MSPELRKLATGHLSLEILRDVVENPDTAYAASIHRRIIDKKEDKKWPTQLDVGKALKVLREIKALTAKRIERHPGSKRPVKMHFPTEIAGLILAIAE